MKKCQSCGTENLDASQFCEECGAYLLQQTNNRQADGNAQQQQQQRKSGEMPAFQSMSGATSIGIPLSAALDAPPPPPQKRMESFGGSKSAAQAVLIIERGGAAGAEFALRSNESHIGRWDADNGVFPDIDLDKHDPEAKISRRHARITRREGGRYFIEDLGSTNGTFVNRGRRLIPGDETALSDGDEIIVGKTFLRFKVGV